MDSVFFEEDLKKAIDCMRSGGIILYPTDTVWGIGCDARNSEAIKKIFALKKRSESQSLLVLVNNFKEVEQLTDEIPEIAYELIEAAVNPITIIYDSASGVAPELIAPDGSLGIRVTHEKFSNELCKRFKGPVVSTSANVHGEKTPTTFREISSKIIEGVDYVVRYRKDDSKEASPSNIIKLEKNGVIKLIR